MGDATARVRRNRIYEKTGGKGKEVGRQIGHHRTAKHKEPQEATGDQIEAQESSPKQPKTARMRQKPRNGWKGT